ncbi:short chain dehydrogenase [Bacillus sp. JCM 19046]|nr:short chain dehydrogenase [Bacillus sp. JCM 19046]
MPHRVSVSVVNPGPIKTPFLATADPSGNYEKAIGRWLLNPENVAKKVILLMEKPKREINVPWWMNLATKAHSLSPNLFERLAYSFLAKK